MSLSLLPPGCTCTGNTPRCPACIEQRLFWHGGTAACRGEDWARAVAARVGTEQDWPPYEGRCAELARDKVRYLCAGDEGTLDALARRCHEHAAYTWRKLRG